MKKSPPFKMTSPAYSKAWMEHARAELAGANRNRFRRSTPGSTKQGNYGPALVLIGGLVVLQAITLLVIFIWVTPTPSQPTDSADIVAALDVPPVVVQQVTAPEPPSPPTPTPEPQGIFERHSSTNNSAIVSPLPTVEPLPIVEPVALAQTTAVRLRGMEITQGIQVFQEPENARCHPDPEQPDHIFCNNSMPMVAGRHTLVRVYLACNLKCPISAMLVSLRLFKDGQEQVSFTHRLSPEMLPRISSLSMPELRLTLDNSINFEFFPPPAWLAGDITFEIEAISEQAHDKLPVTLTLTKAFAVREPLRIAYLPIEYQGLRPPDPTGADYWLQRLYPVPDVEYYRLPVPDVVWDGHVDKGEVLRKLLYTYWFYAQYNPTAPRPDQLFGWLPTELYNGGASDPFWCPNCAGPHSSRVAFGGLRPEQDIGGPRILVHEIAHNFGAQHAWSPTNKEDGGCFKAEGVDIQVDPAWPYAQTPHIQEFGIDLYSNPPVIYPPSIYDMMAYCTQPWISPHTYQKIFESPFLQANSADLLSFSDFEPQVEATEGGTLLVSGVVYPDGTVSKPEIIKLADDAFVGAADGFAPPLEFIPPSGDDYCLDVQAGDDTLLAQHCFDVGFIDLETGLPTEPSPFFFTLPKINTTDVDKVTISKNHEVVVIVTPSNNSPEVTVSFPNDGESLQGQQTITWDAYDADDDPLSYDVLYSPNGGQSWLPLAMRLTETSATFYTSQVLSSNNALIRVITNDGFNTTIDESDAPFTIQPPPENSISLVGPSIVRPGQTFEIDVVANRVTEPGLFGVQFELTFDPGLVQVDAIRAHSDLPLVVNDAIQNDTGQVSLVASRQGRVSNLTGQITLATLTFIAAHNQEQLYLDLHNVVAGARGGISMPISEVQGLTLRITE